MCFQQGDDVTKQTEPVTDSPDGEEPKSTKPRAVKDSTAWSQPFLAYMKRVKGVYGAFGKGIVLLPPFAALLLYMGPPVPQQRSAVASMTFIVEVIVTIQCFRWFYMRRQPPALEKVNKLSTLLAVVCLTTLFLYFIASTILVRPMPDQENRDVIGLYYNSTAARLINPPAYPEDRALERAHYDPERIWASWTVQLDRSLVLILWLTLFGSLSAYVGLLASSAMSGNAIEPKPVGKRPLAKEDGLSQ